mgnify:CR=1 FL=1
MLTLGTARSKLEKYAPEAELVEKINMACELLLTAQPMKGTLEKVTFAVTDGLLTLPRKYYGCLGATVNSTPVSIYNSWFEFVLAGPGAVDTAYNEVIDLGDGWVTITDISSVNAAGCTIRIASDQTEAGSASVLLMGLDADGETIRTADGGGFIEGEFVDIGDTSTTTFTTLSRVVKPVTNGVVKLYAVDGADETLIATYDPNEERPSFRRYRVPLTTDDDTTVTALCQRRHVEAVDDSDELPIDNINALREALMSLQYEDQNDAERASLYLGNALGILNKEQRRYRPASFYPPPVNFIGHVSVPCQF